MTSPSSERTSVFTGSEFLDSIRDDREIYIYGERVRDVTTHPAFRNSARMIARWYDRFHERKATIGTTTDTGSGGLTHPFFQGSKSAQHLIKARDAIAELQRTGFGWMGRSPDYKAALLGTLGPNASFYGDYEGNARAWHKKAQERLYFWNHAIVHPPVDRSRPIEEARDVFMHAEKETDAGLIVSGAKVVATGSALTHYNFIAHHGLPVRDKNFALVFAAPMNAKGVKLIARSSYEFNAAVTGSPFDYPLSSRFDENDAILIFDKVLVPWENVFVYGDVDKVNRFQAAGHGPRQALHGCTRLAVKLDLIAGLFAKAVHATGVGDFRGPQTALGEVIAWRNLFWGLSDAMAKSPLPWAGTDGYVQPNISYAYAYMTMAPMAYPRIRELIERHVASGLIYLPSNAADFNNEEIRPYLDRFVRGSNGVVAVDRVKLLKMLWDAVGTEFAGRHGLYELNYAGSYEQVRVEALNVSRATGELAQMESFVDQALGDYNLDGWTAEDLINPTDVNVVMSGFRQRE